MKFWILSKCEPIVIPCMCEGWNNWKWRRNLRRREVTPEGEFPIGIGDGDIVKFVRGANGGLIVDGGGESSKTKRGGGAWERSEGWRNFVDRIDWIVVDDSQSHIKHSQDKQRRWFRFATFYLLVLLFFVSQISILELSHSNCYGGWHCHDFFLFFFYFLTQLPRLNLALWKFGIRIQPTK